MLVQEVETAIAKAEADAIAERKKALDVVASPDAAAARHAVETAEFALGRLLNVLPRLKVRLEDIEAKEYSGRWRRRYEVVKETRDALAAELRETYPLAKRLADLFSRIASNNEEISALHLARPSGVSLHLRDAELEARGVESYSREIPSIQKELRLPGFEPLQEALWPPSQRSDLSWLGTATGGDARLHTNEWWQVGEEQAAAAREREAQEAKEREAKKLESYHGPKWWEKEGA